MIIGIFLGIALAVSITSAIIIGTTSTGILRENLATGAIIGTGEVVSYASLTLVLSLVVVLGLILLLRKTHHKNFEEY